MQPDFITTNFQLDGYRISKSLGITRGIVVRSRSIVGNFVAALETLFGGNIHMYTELCERARKDAFDRMVQHAEVMGANAVTGFRYDATEVAGGITEVLAYGTACIVEKA